MIIIYIFRGGFSVSKLFRNNFRLRNKFIVGLAASIAIAPIIPSVTTSVAAAEQSVSEKSFETYYKFTTNASSFAMLNTKPAIIEKTDDTYKVTVQVSGYDIFTKFEIDGQPGVAGETFEEQGTDRQGNPTTVTYTKVHFTFDSIDAVKQATVAYSAAGYSMSHDFELDFTPGEYNPSYIAPETYYKGETNSSHFSSLVSKPAHVKYANRQYTVTLDVSGYDIFTKFEIGGQQGVPGETYEEEGTDRQGNPTMVKFTKVAFTFDDLDDVKDALIAYNAGPIGEMSHAFNIDFTPGEYDGTYEQAFDTYYKFQTNSTHFSSLNTKPAKIVKKDGQYAVTLAVSGYNIFTKFEIDGKQGTVISTFEEDGTDRQGNPTKITYSNVEFLFDDIKNVKQATIAYNAGPVQMGHDFALDFTPGEHDPTIAPFETYYKGETNSSHFTAINNKPAKVVVKADGTYDVTLAVSSYNIFTKFEIAGQSGEVLGTFEEDGTDHLGNPAKVTYTNVLFNFDNIDSVKAASIGYNAGPTPMSHDYELDFTPGEYTYAPPADATYDGTGEQVTYTIDTAGQRFTSMLKNMYAEKTATGYTVFVEMASADIVSTFKVNGVAATTVKEEEASNTKVVSFDVANLTDAIAVEAAVKFAPTNMTNFTIQIDAPVETPDEEPTAIALGTGFYDTFLTFNSTTGDSFLHQQSQLFVVDGKAYVQLAVKNAGIKSIAINDVLQTPQKEVTIDGAKYNLYIVPVTNVEQALSVDLSVSIPGVYEHVYTDLQLVLQNIQASEATAFAHTDGITAVTAETELPALTQAAIIFENNAKNPVKRATVERVADGIEMTVTAQKGAITKIAAGTETYYEAARTPSNDSAFEKITFTAPTLDGLTFTYDDEEHAVATVITIADTITQLEDVPAVDVTPETPATPPTTDPSTPETPATPPTTDPSTPETPVTPPTTDPGTPETPVTPPSTDPGTPETPVTPPTTTPGGSTGGGSTGGNEQVQTPNGTYNASISFGSTGDSFLSPTASVIREGDTYKVRVYVKSSDTIQSLSIGNSTQVAKGVYEFTTTSLNNITATMSVSVPAVGYEHTYTNVAVTLTLGNKVNNDTQFPTASDQDGGLLPVTPPPTTPDGSTTVPPTAPGEGNTNGEEQPGTETPDEGDKDTDTDTDTDNGETNEETPAPAPETVVAPFTDIKGLYAEQDIQDLFAAGITTGTTATTYSPQANMTRAQFAVMIARALELSSSTNTVFTDVDGKWYESSVQALYEAGILKGTSNTTFEPGATLTRQQAAAILFRVLEYKGYKATATAPDFADAAKISDYAKPAFATLQQLQILTGDAGAAKPAEHLTRLQMAKLLNSTLKIVKSL